MATAGADLAEAISDLEPQIIATNATLGRGDVVGVGALLVEGTGWRDTLGDDSARLRSLGNIPAFRRDADRGWAEVWE